MAASNTHSLLQAQDFKEHAHSFPMIPCDELGHIRRALFPPIAHQCLIRWPECLASPTLRMYIHNRSANHVLQPKADVLWDHATTVAFGRGEHTVVDPAVRSGRQILPADLTFRPSLNAANTTVQHELEETVRQHVAVIDHHILGRLDLPLSERYARLRVQFAKITLYRAGDHFDWHRDTLRGPHHVATCLVRLPCDHAGGTLYVCEPHTMTEADAEQRALKWGVDDDCPRLFANTLGTTRAGKQGRDMHAIWFHTDAPHKVVPVTQGTRIVWQFDLFLDTDAPLDMTAAAVDAREQAWQDLVDNLVKTHDAEHVANVHGVDADELLMDAQCYGGTTAESKMEAGKEAWSDEFVSPEFWMRGHDAPPRAIRRASSSAEQMFLAWLERHVTPTRGAMIPLFHKYSQASLSPTQLRCTDHAVLSMLARLGFHVLLSPAVFHFESEYSSGLLSPALVDGPDRRQADSSGGACWTVRMHDFPLTIWSTPQAIATGTCTYTDLPPCTYYTTLQECGELIESQPFCEYTGNEAAPRILQYFNAVMICLHHTFRPSHCA